MKIERIKDIRDGAAGSVVFDGNRVEGHWRRDANNEVGAYFCHDYPDRNGGRPIDGDLRGHKHSWFFGDGLPFHFAEQFDTWADSGEDRLTVWDMYAMAAVGLFAGDDPQDAALAQNICDFTDLMMAERSKRRETHR